MKRRYLLTGAVVGLVLGFSVPSLAKSARTTAAVLNLKAVWQALDIYAESHEGNLPQSLEELVPAYFQKEVLIDPYCLQRIVYLAGGEKWKMGNDDRVIAYSSWRGADGIELLESGAVIRNTGLPAEFKRNTASIPSEHNQLDWLWLYLLWLVGSVVAVCWVGWAHLKQWRIWRRIATACGLFVILLASPILLTFCIEWLQSLEHREHVLARLQNLGASLQTYAKDHDGRCPNDIRELVPKHLHDTRELVGYEMRYGWVYQGQGKSWTEAANAANEVVVSCASARGDGGYVLYNGGRVGQLKQDDLAAILPGKLKEYARY